MLYKKLTQTAITPHRATSGSAGYDLFADMDADIMPHQIVMVHTGIAIALDDEHTAALVYARSGLSAKYGITLANCVGVVDSDYRGEIKVALINHSNTAYHVCKGDRIAQMVLTPILTPPLVEVSELSETARGDSGYGSSGK